MKKLIASLTLALLLPTSALALTPSESVEELNLWLQDNGGIDFINTKLQETKAKAHEEWDDRAALYDFTFNRFSDGMYHFEFSLSSMDTEENDYHGSPDPNNGGSLFTTLIDNNPDINPSLHIYGVDFLMRDMVTALMEDEWALSVLDSIFDEDAEIELTINLSKNDDRHLMWTTEFTDHASETTYMVKTSAQTSEDPFFMIFRKTSE